MHGMEASGAPEIVKYVRSTVKLRRGSRGCFAVFVILGVGETRSAKRLLAQILSFACGRNGNTKAYVCLVCVRRWTLGLAESLLAIHAHTHTHNAQNPPCIVATCRPRNPLESECISHLAQIKYSFLQCQIFLPPMSHLASALTQLSFLTPSPHTAGERVVAARPSGRLEAKRLPSLLPNQDEMASSSSSSPTEIRPACLLIDGHHMQQAREAAGTL